MGFAVSAANTRVMLRADNDIFLVVADIFWWCRNVGAIGTVWCNARGRGFGIGKVPGTVLWGRMYKGPHICPNDSFLLDFINNRYAVVFQKFGESIYPTQPV